ncbi:MAG TPA: hypothetical protein ENJ95_24260 [Bacteroidetes bacterium]|nr:hypothetical protein [Bacteroidota bacterium]
MISQKQGERDIQEKTENERARLRRFFLLLQKKSTKNMLHDDLLPYRQNLAFKKEFELLGLDLAEVFEFTPLDLDLENSRLEHLLDFVKKYQQYGSQEVMELVEGRFCFPPIFPGISPESDWHRFKLWLNGEVTRKTIEEQLPTAFEVKDPSIVPDEELETELERLLDAVFSAGYGIALNEGIPPRIVYGQVLEWIGHTVELSSPDGGGWTFDGCTGYCPGCFQRPWCETGHSSCWPEDEKAGKMQLPGELKDYVSASPQSLDILRELQAKEDAEMKKFDEERGPQEDGTEEWKFRLN